jgi:hypothetical protein
MNDNTTKFLKHFYASELLTFPSFVLRNYCNAARTRYSTLLHSFDTNTVSPTPKHGRKLLFLASEG